MARILYFTRDYTTHDRRFLEALTTTEHQVYYLRLERGSYTLEDRPVPSEIHQASWAGGTSPFRWQEAPRLLRSLKEVLQSIRPDLVQAGPIQTCAFLAALSGFRPLVSMSWGYDLIIDAHRSRPMRWATEYTLRRSSALVGDSDTVRRQAKLYGMADDRIVTFPWGIDLEHFSPQGESLSFGTPGVQAERPFILLSSRAWEPIYGVDVIARAFIQAAQERPQLHLLMLGNGSQAAWLHEVFDRAGLQERIHFTGQVSQVDLPRFYRSADLYVSASHSDGTSISLLEAMACGNPVLVSDIEGNREWVDPSVNGWWFRDGDASDLARRILEAVDQRNTLKEMGKAARRLTEQRADWKINFPCLFNAYRLALESPVGVRTYP